MDFLLNFALSTADLFFGPPGQGTVELGLSLSVCWDVNEKPMRCNGVMSCDFGPEELVALLASPNERVRAQAVKALKSAGALAQAALRAGAAHPSDQVSRQCRELLALLAEPGPQRPRRSTNFWRRLTAKLPRRTLARRMGVPSR